MQIQMCVCIYNGITAVHLKLRYCELNVIQLKLLKKKQL